MTENVQELIDTLWTAARKKITRLALGLICMISLASTSCSLPNSMVAGRSEHEPPYIYSFPDKYIAGFVLVTLSADGNVVAGTVDEQNYWVWNKVTGTSRLSPPLVGYQIEENSITASSDGTALTGALGVPWPNNQGTQPKLFRWTAAAGMTILPTLPASDSVRNVLISDDGKSISFVCTTADGKPCTGPPFPQGGEHQELKIWTAAQGYQSVGPDFGNDHNFIEQSPDLKRFLVGNSYNYWKYVNGHRAGLYDHVDPFALMDASGKITSFQPPLRDYYPSNVFTNSEISLVADKTLMHGPGWNTVVYDSSGALVATKLPKGCMNFTVTAIDGQKHIFGEAYCPGFPPVGLRISSSGAETISQWLKDGGLNYNFPMDTSIFKVSDDGKTVQGFVDPGVGTCGCAVRGLTKPPATTGPPGSQYGFDPTSSFIAHVN